MSIAQYDFSLTWTAYHSTISAPRCKATTSPRSRSQRTLSTCRDARARRMWPPAHRRDLRSRKKCPSKKCEAPPTHAAISEKTSRADQFFQRGKTVLHWGFTALHTHREMTWTHPRTHRKRTGVHNQYQRQTLDRDGGIGPSASHIRRHPLSRSNGRHRLPILSDHRRWCRTN